MKYVYDFLMFYVNFFFYLIIIKKIFFVNMFKNERNILKIFYYENKKNI